MCKERRAYPLSCQALRTIFRAAEIFANLKDTAFYFQTYNDRFELKNIPLGIHSLNKIVRLRVKKLG